jgi:hypothetical protein
MTMLLFFVPVNTGGVAFMIAAVHAKRCGEYTIYTALTMLLLLLSFRPNASEGRRLSQVGLVSSVSLCTWNELVRL